MLYFTTYIKGDTPFPEFSAVLMLDDIPLAYYSSNEQKLIPRGPMNEEDIFLAITGHSKFALTTMHKIIRTKAHTFIRRYNRTDGEH